MTTLSATELTRIRRKTGSVAVTDDMPDSEIQYHYDLATADAPDAELVLPFTYVYILRDLWGLQRLRPDRSTSHGDKQTRSQIKDTSKELLDYWEKVAGLSGGKIRTGTLDLDLDEDAETQ